MARATRVRTCATIAHYQDMQLTTPIEPAMAVSTAINTLRTSFQSFFIFVDLRFLIYLLFSRFLTPPLFIANEAFRGLP